MKDEFWNGKNGRFGIKNRSFQFSTDNLKVTQDVNPDPFFQLNFVVVDYLIDK